MTVSPLTGLFAIMAYAAIRALFWPKHLAEAFDPKKGPARKFRPVPSSLPQGKQGQ